MKKITFYLSVLVISASSLLDAQETTFYYDDFRFPTNSGYTSFVTSNPNAIDEATLIVRPLAPVPESVLGYTRPSNNIGARSDVREQQSVRLSGNDGSSNFLGTTWIVTDAVDISAKSNAIVSFATRNRFLEGTGGDPFTVMYALNYTDGTDPDTVTWVDITSDIVSLSTDSFGTDNIWTFQYIDLTSYIGLSGSDEFAFAFKYDFNDDGVFSSTNNRNGSWFISDVRFVENSPVLSVNNNVLNQALKVYPNPVSSTLNIVNNKSINIKELSIVNIIGKTVYKGNATNTIDVSNYAKGIYVLKIESENNGVLNKKIVID